MDGAWKELKEAEKKKKKTNERFSFRKKIGT